MSLWSIFEVVVGFSLLSLLASTSSSVFSNFDQIGLMIFLHAETTSSNEGEAAILVDPGDDGVAELEEGAGVQDARVRLGLSPADPPSDPPWLEEGADQVKEGTSLLNADGLAFLLPPENIALV